MTNVEKIDSLIEQCLVMELPFKEVKSVIKQRGFWIDDETLKYRMFMLWSPLIKPRKNNVKKKTEEYLKSILPFLSFMDHFNIPMNHMVQYMTYRGILNKKGKILTYEWLFWFTRRAGWRRKNKADVNMTFEESWALILSNFPS